MVGLSRTGIWSSPRSLTTERWFDSLSRSRTSASAILRSGKFRRISRARFRFMATEEAMILAGTYRSQRVQPIMSTAAQTQRQTQMEVSIARVQEAIRRAAETNQMPVPEGGVSGGAWQWSWYAPTSADRVFKVNVDVEPSEKGLLVGGQSINWSRRGERHPVGETWFSRFYLHEECKTEQLLRDLTQPLRKAWGAACQASTANAQVSA